MPIVLIVELPQQFEKPKMKTIELVAAVAVESVVSKEVEEFPRRRWNS